MSSARMLGTRSAEIGVPASTRGMSALRRQPVPDHEDVIFVTEVWSDSAARAASLDNADTRALIARAAPLLAHPAVSTVLRPVGGKGVVASAG